MSEIVWWINDAAKQVQEWLNLKKIKIKLPYFLYIFTWTNQWRNVIDWLVLPTCLWEYPVKGSNYSVPENEWRRYQDIKMHIAEKYEYTWMWIYMNIYEYTWAWCSHVLLSICWNSFSEKIPSLSTKLSVLSPPNYLSKNM